MTMITDGQILFESFIGGGTYSPYKGLGLVLGSGQAPDFDSVISACKGSTYRSVSALGTYLKVTLGLPIHVDYLFSDMIDKVYGNKVYFNFLYAATQPDVILAGIPTWGLILIPNYISVTTGSSALAVSSFMRIYAFSVGTANADFILPAPLVTGSKCAVSNITLTLSNVVGA